MAVQHSIFKHTCPLTYWCDHDIGKLSMSFLRLSKCHQPFENLHTHCQMMLCNITYKSLTFDLKYVMLIWKDCLSQFSAFDNANTLYFENGHSHPLPHMVVHYNIFKHLWPWILNMWLWHWNNCLCKFSACMKANLSKIIQ